MNSIVFFKFSQKITKKEKQIMVVNALLKIVFLDLIKGIYTLHWMEPYFMFVTWGNGRANPKTRKWSERYPRGERSLILEGKWTRAKKLARTKMTS